MFKLRPLGFRKDRWQTRPELERVISKHALQSGLGGTYPPSRLGTTGVQAGIYNEEYGEIWSLTRAGQFVCAMPFSHGVGPFKSPARNLDGTPAEKEFGSGEWVDYLAAVRNVADFFCFASKLSSEFQAAESICLDVIARPLAGKHLVSKDFHHRMSPIAPAVENQFSWSVTMTVEQFRSQWRSLCSRALTDFFELFPLQFGQIPENTILSVVQRHFPKEKE